MEEHEHEHEHEHDDVLYTDDNYLSQLILSHALFRKFNYDDSISVLKEILSKALSYKNRITACECLLNIAICYFYNGMLSESYYNITEASRLIKEIENAKGCKIKYKIKSHLILITLTMNLCDEALEHLNSLVDMLSNTSSTSLKKDMFILCIKDLLNFYTIDQDNVLDNIKKYSFDRLLTANSRRFGEASYVKLKSFHLLYCGFIMYLQKENNEGMFIRHLQESINNLNCLNENYLLTVCMLNMSLMKIISGDVSTSKQIFADFVKAIAKVKSESKIKESSREKEIIMASESLFSKIINEQFQKFETSKIIIATLVNFYQSSIKDISCTNTYEKNIILHLLNKAKKDLLFNTLDDNLKESITKRYDTCIEILRCFEYSSDTQTYLSIDPDVIQYYQNLMSNLNTIVMKFLLKRHIQRWVSSTFKYDTIEAYRSYIRKCLVCPRMDKYYIRCIEQFKNYGYHVVKFNFNTNGKKERYIKYSTECNINSAGSIVFSYDKRYSNTKKILLSNISSVIFGINSTNLKRKYPQIKQEKFKVEWNFMSFIVKGGNTSKGEYRSIDIFALEDIILHEIFFALNKIKRMYDIPYPRMMSNCDFVIQKLKYKMIHYVRIHKKSQCNLDVECNWSFVRLFLYLVKHQVPMSSV